MRKVIKYLLTPLENFINFIKRKGFAFLTGLVLAFAGCISFISLYSYAESGKDTSSNPLRDSESQISSEYSQQNVSNGLNLPQGVKPVRDNTENQELISNGLELATEEKVGADTALSKSNGVQQEEKSSSKTLEKAQGRDAYEKPPLSEEESIKGSSPEKHGLAELRAYVNKSTITIGEKVTYTLEIDTDNDLKVEFPSYVTGLGGFVVKDFGEDEERMGKNRTRRKQWYLLDTYTTGSYVIPKQEMIVELPNGKRETLKSPEIFVEVKSVMDEEGEKAGLRDIKGPLTVKKGAPIILITVILLIILAVAGLILWRLYLKKIAAQKKEPALLPDEIAFRELERIEGLGLLEKSKIKEYYYLVSLALRTYLENRFSLKAPEQTTEEFLESIVNSDKLEGKYINILKEYLNHCDLVKYAKFDPGKARAKALADTTRRFIEETAKKKEEVNDVVNPVREEFSNGVNNKAEA